MIYVIYQDDGPKGFCGQSMSITCPWHKLYRLKDYDAFRVFRDHIESIASRANPRIVGAFDDTEAEFTGLDEVYDWEPKA